MNAGEVEMTFKRRAEGRVYYPPISWLHPLISLEADAPG